MATGVSVNDDVISAFNEFKLGRGEFKLKYFIYKIENKKNIVIESTGPLEKTYDDFVGELPENGCRYGLIDVEFETEEGREAKKMVLVTWAPDTASVREKMLYAGSKEALRVALNGVGININATDFSELDYTTAVLPVVRKFS